MASKHRELVEKLDEHKIEVSKLKNTLNGLHKDKESWFKNKQELSAKIKGSIQKIKDSKAKRDSLTHDVKELKAKRDSTNKEIAAKLNELNSLKKEKIVLVKSLGIKETHSKIKQDIEKLEFKIETEAISFEKEQSLMRKIKELRKLYDDAGFIIEVDNKIMGISGTIKNMRNEANGLHKSIEEKAKQSQVLHEEILKISAEIDKIKIEEEDAFKKFSELKQKFNEANAQLKERLKAMNEIKSQLDKMDFEKKEKRRLEEELFLKSKEEEVNQKIKRGGKLTTEDLLVFQKLGRG